MLELDAPMFDALELELSRRWPAELELIASLVEVSHAQLAAFVIANSKKGTPAPKTLRIPRPGDESDSSSSTPSPADVRVSASGFARMFAGRVRAG